MNDPDRDNLFADDPALDCMIFEHLRKQERKSRGGCGCLGLLLLVALPAAYGSLRWMASSLARCFLS